MVLKTVKTIIIIEHLITALSLLNCMVCVLEVTKWAGWVMGHNKQSYFSKFVKILIKSYFVKYDYKSKIFTMLK